MRRYELGRGRHEEQNQRNTGTKLKVADRHAWSAQRMRRETTFLAVSFVSLIFLICIVRTAAMDGLGQCDLTDPASQAAEFARRFDRAREEGHRSRPQEVDRLPAGWNKENETDYRGDHDGDRGVCALGKGVRLDAS